MKDFADLTEQDVEEEFLDTIVGLAANLYTNRLLNQFVSETVQMRERLRHLLSTQPGSHTCRTDVFKEIPEYVDGAIHYHGSPQLMAQYALHARDAGATVIGGCCGTTPEHIAAMVAALDESSRDVFDGAAMNEALGIPWKHLPVISEEGQGKAGRRSRRRHG